MFPVYRYEQQDESHLYGVDLGFHYHPHFAHWFHVETSYSLIYGESLNRENMSLIPQPRLNNLVRLTFKKRFKFNLEEVVIQHMNFFEQNRVTTFESKSVEYGLLNAGFNFKWYLKQPIEISLGVKNALNTRYANHLSKLKNIGVFSPGRNFYVSLTYQLSGNLKNSN
jgi:iron complex outermembrane receptor protein